MGETSRESQAVLEVARSSLGSAKVTRTYTRRRKQSSKRLRSTALTPIPNKKKEKMPKRILTDMYASFSFPLFIVNFRFKSLGGSSGVRLQLRLDTVIAAGTEWRLNTKRRLLPPKLRSYIRTPHCCLFSQSPQPQTDLAVKVGSILKRHTTKSLITRKRQNDRICPTLRNFGCVHDKKTIYLCEDKGPVRSS